MTTGRRAAVYAMMAVIVGGHLYDIVTGAEHWPFSPSPMYAYANRSFELDAPWLVGVRAETMEEVPLQIGIRVLLGPSFVPWMIRNVLWVPWDRLIERGRAATGRVRAGQSRAAALRAAS